MARVNPNIIDREEAFLIYYDLGRNRSLDMLLESLVKSHPGKVPAIKTLKNWSKDEGWQLRIMVLDKEIRDGVKEIMMPEWIEIKVGLLKMLMEQIKEGKSAGVIPANTRDLVAASREIRALMGEGDNVDVSISKIEYVPYQKQADESKTHKSKE